MRMTMRVCFFCAGFFILIPDIFYFIDPIIHKKYFPIEPCHHVGVFFVKRVFVDRVKLIPIVDDPKRHAAFFQIVSDDRARDDGDNAEIMRVPSEMSLDARAIGRDGEFVCRDEPEIVGENEPL